MAVGPQISMMQDSVKNTLINDYEMIYMCVKLTDSFSGFWLELDVNWMSFNSSLSIASTSASEEAVQFAVPLLLRSKRRYSVLRKVS
jgi:hypothetical protein